MPTEHQQVTAIYSLAHALLLQISRSTSPGRDGLRPLPRREELGICFGESGVEEWLV